jgi:integrase
MASRTLGLTVAKVGSFGPGYHADGGGLYLQVAPGGGRSWIFRYQIAGRRRDMGLGSTSIVGLAEARRVAHECRRLLFEGIDPLERKRAGRSAAALEAAKAITFRQCAEGYIAAHKAGWRDHKSQQQWEQSLAAYVYPLFGTLPVQAIDVGLVLKAIESLWTEKPETASRVRGRIESVLDWATARGYRTGENPARWRGHLENLLPKRSKVRKVEHHPALPYPEIAAFVAELRQQEGVAARALEFAILTAARSGEVLGARWSEFDMANRIWTIPGDRMKAGKEHRVPLSDAAMAVVEQMAAVRLNDYVFPGLKKGQSASTNTMFYALRHMNRGDLTAHGFRSTFRDWCAEHTAFPAEVAEMALAHVVGDKVEAAYRRGDLFEKRRQLAEAWAKFCDAPAITGGEVVALRKA